MAMESIPLQIIQKPHLSFEDENKMRMLESAAYAANLNYRMLNNPETLNESEAAYARVALAARDARQEDLKRQAAFSQPRDDLSGPHSARYNEIVAQYEQQRYSTIYEGDAGIGRVSNPQYGLTPSFRGYDTSALGIAMEVTYFGGKVNRYFAEKVYAQEERIYGSVIFGVNVSDFSGRLSDYESDLKNYTTKMTGYMTNQFYFGMYTGGLALQQLAQNDLLQSYLDKKPFISSPDAGAGRTPSADIFSPIWDVGGFVGENLKAGIDFAYGRAYDAGAGVRNAISGIFTGFGDLGAGAFRNTLSPNYQPTRMDTISSAWGGRGGDVGLSAQFVGKGENPLYAPIKGSDTEAFAYDYWGKVLHVGSEFERTRSQEGVPYNPKVGHGDYVYIGEYKYNTGEVVSRYVEQNVGSYVDFGQGGMAFTKQVVVRGGGSPSAYYYTNQPTYGSGAGPVYGYTSQQNAVMRQISTMGASRGASADPFAAIFGSIRGTGVDVTRYMNTKTMDYSGGNNDFWGSALRGLGIMTGYKELGGVAASKAIGTIGYEEKYAVAPGYGKDIGLSAQFMGKGTSPVFSPIPGSVTERFAFDEYGKVLAPGQEFSPAYSAEGVPYNPKMGNGEYVYAGEFRYDTGEQVSRYVNPTVGSFVDFGQGGMAFTKQVVIRGGGSPDSLYYTVGHGDYMSATAVDLNKGTINTGTGDWLGDFIGGFSGGIGGGVEGVADFFNTGFQKFPDYVSLSNRAIAMTPMPGMPMIKAGGAVLGAAGSVFGDTLMRVNKAGMEERLGFEIESRFKDFNDTYKQYQESGIIDKSGNFRAGTEAQQYELMNQKAAIDVFTINQQHLQKEIVAPPNAGGFFGEGRYLKPYTDAFYGVMHGGAEFWTENPLSKAVGGAVDDRLKSQSGRDTIAAWSNFQSTISPLQYAPLVGPAAMILSTDNPFIINTPEKAIKAARGVVGTAPAGTMEFLGMVPSGLEIVGSSATALPALAIAGTVMQLRGIKEGLETRPTEFFYEQAGMAAIMHTIPKASPVGGGVLNVPALEKGMPSTTFYAVYSKMPFAKEGGVPSFMMGIADMSGTRLSIGMSTPARSFNIVPQSPIAMGRVSFFTPSNAEMGFVGIRPPVALESNPSIGMGYVRGGGSVFSPFVGSPTAKFTSLLDKGWKFSHQFPFEFEKGYKPGFSSAEMFVLPKAVMRTPEFGLMKDVLAAQDVLKSGSAMTQKMPYAYRHADITPAAWDAFIKVLQRPEYKNDVVTGGSTFAELFVERGKFRPLKSTADTDLYVEDTILERLATDINRGMGSHQSNIFMDIDRSGTSPAFSIGVKGVKGEKVSVIEGHAFSAFPAVLEQTRWVDVAGGGKLRTVSPEYTLRSKLAGSMFSFRVSKGSEVELVYKRLKDFPDAISLSRDASTAYPAYSDIFNRISDDYTRMIFSRRAAVDMVDIARIRSRKPSWIAEHPGVTQEDLIKEMREDLSGYRKAVSGFKNVPFNIPRDIKPTSSYFGMFGDIHASISSRSYKGSGEGLIYADVTMGIPRRSVVGYKYSINWGAISRFRPFTGSPVAILREKGFRISPSMETKEGPWTNIQHAIFDKYLIENLPTKQARIVKTSSPAINAAYSGLFKPVQRAPLGELPSTSFTKGETIGLMSVWSEYRGRFAAGGSRAQNVWFGEAGPSESKFGSDWDTYTDTIKTTNEIYQRNIERLKITRPDIEKYSHPGTSIKGPQASITTIKGEEGVHIKPYAPKYEYMKGLGTASVETVGGFTVDIINPRGLFKRSMAGIFSAIEQKPGGKPYLVIDRAKDIVPSYQLARSFARSLYKSPMLDVGGVYTGLRVSRAAALEEYSLAILDYVSDLPLEDRASVNTMLSESRMDLLKGVDRNPEAYVDLLTGKGWLDQSTHGWNEEAVLLPRGRSKTGVINEDLMYEREVSSERYPVDSYPRGRSNKAIALVAIVSPKGLNKGYPSSYPSSFSVHTAYPVAYLSGRITPDYPMSYPGGNKRPYPGGGMIVNRYPTGQTTKYPSGYPPSYPPSTPPSYPPGTPPSHPPGHPPSYPPGTPPSHPPGHPPSYPPGTPPTYPPGYPPLYPPGHPPGYPPGTPPPNRPPWYPISTTTINTPWLTTTYTTTKKIRRGRRKRSRKTSEWYIWNPVPLAADIFGPKVSMPWEAITEVAAEHIHYPGWGKMKKLPPGFSQRPRF